jgi:hypothetical protein
VPTLRGASLPCGCDAHTRGCTRCRPLVDDVHVAARLPGHLIMGALINVMNRHRDEVEAETRAAGGQIAGGSRRRTPVLTLITSRART